MDLVHRFFISPDLLSPEEIELPAEIGHQLTRVLRLRVEDRVVLCPGDGTEWTVAVTEIQGKAVRVTPVERRTPDVDLRCDLHVAVAVLKGEKLDWTLQKLTEWGARRISLLSTERTISSAGEERWSKRLERYRRIVREAAEQCGGTRVPEVAEPRKIAEVLESAGPGPARLILDPYAERSLTRQLAPCPERVLVLIGPEGGFSPEEVRQAAAHGATPVKLGRRVLRAETAALAAATLVATASEPYEEERAPLGK
jgi:16S rRNA (uracil1498-N3)-methyltransferase